VVESLSRAHVRWRFLRFASTQREELLRKSFSIKRASESIAVAIKFPEKKRSSFNSDMR
jgi:hypothetical protein